MNGTERPVYSISAVSRMLGVPVATIRTWEDRYGLVVPERNGSGHRLYRRDQVEQLKFVRASIVGGVSAADAHRLLAERIAGAPGVPASRGSGARLLILLADHDPYAAEYQEYLLQTEGFAVDIALSAGEARALVTERPPALAIVELLISGGTGLDLCRSFKERGVPVIAASALDARGQAVAAGADAFLLKPVEPVQLISSVRDLLGAGAYLRSAAGGAP